MRPGFPKRADFDGSSAIFSGQVGIVEFFLEECVVAFNESGLRPIIEGQAFDAAEVGRIVGDEGQVVGQRCGRQQ